MKTFMSLSKRRSRCNFSDSISGLSLLLRKFFLFLLIFFYFFSFFFSMQLAFLVDALLAKIRSDQITYGVCTSGIQTSIYRPDYWPFFLSAPRRKRFSPLCVPPTVKISWEHELGEFYEV